MKPTEAAALLTICAAYDNRKPDADAAKAWALALDGLRFDDCRDAIVKHYQVSREWIMPADVRTEVKRIRSSRLEDAPPLCPPPGMDPDDTAAFQMWLRKTREAIADGRDPETVEYVATRQIGDLSGVLRALPSPERMLRESPADHAERMAQARAELANHPAAVERVRAQIPGVQSPPLRETEEKA